MCDGKTAILVTGGAGYIGSHVCKSLQRAGYLPVTYDHLERGHEDAVLWGPLVKGDVHDKNLLFETLKSHAIKAVIHLAAYISVEESVHDPLKYYDNNTVGTLSLLQAMEDADVNHLIFSSTACVYSNSTVIPIPESLPCQPISPYGSSKVMAEMMIQGANVNAMILRYFNAAGADSEVETGCRTALPNNLIPILLSELSHSQEPSISILGTDYETHDGTALRDYIHVTDLAEAHVAALGYLLEGGKSDIVNIGTGTGHSVREVIEMVEACTGMLFIKNEVARRAGDPPILIANAQKAHDLLGWVAQYSDLETIIQTAWRWHQHYHQKNMEI